MSYFQNSVTIAVYRSRRLSWFVPNLWVMVFLLLFANSSIHAQSSKEKLYETRSTMIELLTEQKYEKALPVIKTYMELVDQVFGRESYQMLRALLILENAYHNLGRYHESRLLVQQQLEVIENNPHRFDPKTVAGSLRFIAVRYAEWGLYEKAEALYHECLKIYETVYGPEHFDVGAILTALASVYDDQDRYVEAEALLHRALSIFENEQDPDLSDAGVGLVLNNLSNVYSKQDRYDEVERLLERSLIIFEQGRLPPIIRDNFVVVLTNLAVLYVDQGRYAEADSVFARSLKIAETIWAPENWRLALLLEGIARLYTSQGRYSDAESLYKRALLIYEKAEQSPSVASVVYGMSFLYQYQGLYDLAINYIRRATLIHRHRLTSRKTKDSRGLTSEQYSHRLAFLKHIELALHPNQQGSRSELEAEAYEVLQLARSSITASAIVRMAARFASSDDQMASLLREQQDALAYYQKLDADLINSLSNTAETQNSESVSQIRDNLASVAERIGKLTQTIQEKFPKYAELTSRHPLGLTETLDLLDQDEGLLTFIRSFDGNQTHVFVIRHDRSIAYTVELGIDELEEIVSKLRAGVAVSGVKSRTDLPVFDTEIAFELYQRLLSPAKDILSGVKHLFVVPDGPLQSLPLGILVTAPPKKRPEKLSDYQDIPWLYRDYAITTLPSVASLRALRVFTKKSKATKPFIGFGDPVLSDELSISRGLELTAFYRGSLANVEEVRKLGSLPKTAQELKTVAKYLGADSNSVFLREKATETKVKALPLNEYKVVAFSTHGLISGELKGLAEPALVLTPPREATTIDDGLLTAREVAQLKLDANWVILSACNTAAGEKPSAEGLSGLAKAFFYAGARALLVSHWPVESSASVALMSNMFNAIKNYPTIRRAEALRQSMMQLASNELEPFSAHPLFWAPFVVVGEGGH